MKHFFSFLLLTMALVISGCGRESQPKLTMATSATFPPYEYIAEQKIDGIDPAIMRNIAGKLGYELEILDMSFESVIASVQSGKADIAASGLTITEERKKQVNFTIPYVIAEQVILVKNNSPIAGEKDLKNKKIAVQHGTTGDLYVTENITEPERFSSGAVAVAALMAGKVDAVVIDREPAEVYVLQKSTLRILPEALVGEEYAFAVNKNNPELLIKINNELSKLKESGELASIIDLYKSISSEGASETVVEAVSFWGKLKASFHINFVKDARYRYLLKGFYTTLLITCFAVLLGIVIGFAVAVIRSAHDQAGKFKVLNCICQVYLTVIRGTPAVVQLLIIYFVIFGAVDVAKILVAIVAFGINSGAYVAEIIRGGIMSIDRGQMEAGRSLGLSYNQTMNSVILPQAFKNVLPALGNEFIVLLKETSVSGYIALQDLTKAGDVIRSQTYDAFFPLIAVALIYLAVVMFLSWLLGKLEKRLKKNE